jgi:hypothetical protein
VGWSYRKSVNIGPFRVNLSRSGVGYSIGGMGFRTGMRAGGRRYSSVSVPGTGLRYQTSGGGPQPRSGGCAVLAAAICTALGAVVLVGVWFGAMGGQAR